jgi:hypothetical protein
MKTLEQPGVRRAIRLCILPVVCIGLAACAAAGPKILSQSDPGADFSRYRTFGFLDEAAGSQPVYSSFIGQYLKKAVAREMQARGLTAAANPDLLVNFNLVTKDKVQVTQTPSGYYGYRRGYYASGGMASAITTDVSSYTEGTLSVDVIDKPKMQLVWEATAIGRIKDKALENPEPAVNQVISQLFEKFPRGAGSSSPGS